MILQNSEGIFAMITKLKVQSLLCHDKIKALLEINKTVSEFKCISEKDDSVSAICSILFSTFAKNEFLVFKKCKLDLIFFCKQIKHALCKFVHFKGSEQL
jgi:hypothetical protein